MWGAKWKQNATEDTPTGRHTCERKLDEHCQRAAEVPCRAQKWAESNVDTRKLSVNAGARGGMEALRGAQKGRKENGDYLHWKIFAAGPGMRKEWRWLSG